MVMWFIGFLWNISVNHIRVFNLNHSCVFPLGGVVYSGFKRLNTLDYWLFISIRCGRFCRYGPVDESTQFIINRRGTLLSWRASKRLVEKRFQREWMKWKPLRTSSRCDERHVVDLISWNSRAAKINVSRYLNYYWHTCTTGIVISICINQYVCIYLSCNSLVDVKKK